MFISLTDKKGGRLGTAEAIGKKQKGFQRSACLQFRAATSIQRSATFEVSEMTQHKLSQAS